MRKLKKQNIIYISILLAVCLTVYLLLSSAHRRQREVVDTPTQAPEQSYVPTPEIVYDVHFNFPYSPVPVGDRPITLDTFETSWASIGNNGYITPNQNGFDGVTLSVGCENGKLEDIIYYRDGIPFEADTNYELYFSASSSVNRNIRVCIYDATDNSIFYEQVFALTPEAQSYSLQFHNGNKAIWTGRIAFQVGFDGPNTNAEHYIDLSSIRFLTSRGFADIKVNQVGYYTSQQKHCVFPYNAGDSFDVINADTGGIVYTAPLLNGRHDETTGEENFYGDFTNLKDPGTYYIRSQIGTTSPRFVIADNPYLSLDDDLLKMISMQRCGQDLDASWAGSMAHGICHTDNAVVYGTDTALDVTGGWHDAGDYGRYVKTGTKAVSDLLWAYIANPGIFTDNYGTASSNNGVPDLLDEARYELEWMLKMQASSGGVYTKAVTQNMASFVDPVDDHQSLYVLDIETSSTGTFAGTMALAYDVFKDVDKDFAKRCLDAAINADNYLNQHPENQIVRNPSEIIAGGYIDETDDDARYFAKAGLYVATQDEKYLEAAKNIYNARKEASDGLSWSTQGGYGTFALLFSEELQKEDSEFYETLKNNFLTKVNESLSRVKENSFESAIYTYGWGSNGDFANQGIEFSYAYRLTGNTEYYDAAIEQLNYILGKNSLNICFVSGYGTTSPVNVHSRVAVAHNTLLKGALVGGPDEFREDPVTEQMGDNVPTAKRYADALESYSSNEITVYWNSALLSLLSSLS